MTKEELIRELNEAPANIWATEQAVIVAAAEADRVVAELENKKASLLLGGAVTGKNEETRKAQLWEATKTEREALDRTQQGLLKAKAQLSYQQNKFAALRAIARLLAGEVE